MKNREKVSSLLYKVTDMVTHDTEIAGLLNAFFALVFIANTSPQESQTLKVREERSPLVSVE